MLVRFGTRVRVSHNTTNVLGKQVINMMACGTLAFFLEHFNMELRRESATNLFHKLVDCKHRVRESTRKSIDGFTAAPINEHDDVVELSADGDDCIEPRIATLDKHFRNTPVFYFCSDSPSVMVALRRCCMDIKEFLLAFGCAPHALHNFYMDVIKKFEGYKLIVKDLVRMVKGIRSVHTISALFDKLCCENSGKTLVLILFTKSRWTTVFFAAQRANRVKQACTDLPGEISHPNLDIDISDELRSMLIDSAYWKGVTAMEVFFTLICSCLTYLEGDEATLSLVYVCLLAILFHVKTMSKTVRDTFGLTADCITEMKRHIAGLDKTNVWDYGAGIGLPCCGNVYH
jgi:hypothetical protein